jgi:two-component system LytT family sensor kinase
VARWSFTEVPVIWLILGSATVAGVFFTAQIYFVAMAFCQDVSWAQAAYWAFGDWYEWALLSPAIFWLCRLCAQHHLSWAARLAVLIPGAVVFAIVHAAMCAVAAMLQGWVLGPPVGFESYLRHLLATRTPFNIAVFIIIVVAWHGWRHCRSLRERDAQLADLHGRLAEAQLQALRLQLNPHFLHNTLNAVSSLMLTDVCAANRMITRLGTLLRTALDGEAGAEVALARELALLEDYLEIEKIRFGDRLRVRMQPDSDTLGAAVPNFLLQPIVENSIRHAIEQRERDGQITVRTCREGGRLRLEVEDNGTGTPGAPNFLRGSGSGRNIGLHNTRQRLEKLYGGAQQFVLSANPAGGVTATITIPFRPFSPA